MSGEPTRWISRDRLRSADQKFVIQLKRLRGKTFFAMEIPLPLLKKWHNVVNEQASDRGRTSGQNSATGSETEQADSSQGQWKRRICGSSTVHLYLTRCSPLRIIKLWGKNLRLFYEICSCCCAIIKGNQGKDKKDLDEKMKKVQVYEGQTKSVKEWYEEIECLKCEIQKWRSKTKILEEERNMRNMTARAYLEQTKNLS